MNGKTLWGSAHEVEAVVNTVDISVSAYAEPHLRPAPARGRDRAASAVRHKPHGVLAVLGPYELTGPPSNGATSSGPDRRQCNRLKPSEKTPAVGEYWACT